jgi:hypothetical protein
MTKNNKQNRIESGIQTIFIVPPGVEDIIFPWGIHSLKEYLGKTRENLGTAIWDCRLDPQFNKLHEDYSPLLGRLFFSLKMDQINTLFGATSNPYLFLGLAAFTGSDFLQLIGKRKWFNRKSERALTTLKKALSIHLEEKIDGFIQQSGGKHRIWGFSVYDRTLFNCLHMAQIIKEKDPHSSIILGGDYFDFKSAAKAMAGISFIDGIVVGYGEDAVKKIIDAYQSGRDIADAQIPGLVNRCYLKQAGNLNKPDEINVPDFYKQLSCSPPISYVQEHPNGDIRILAQRGCSWGKCSFCTQIDKDMFFPISADHIIEDIKKIIASKDFSGDEPEVKISFDADENSIEMFVQFIGHLNRMDHPNLRFKIILWLQVKMFRKELAEALSKIDNKKIQVHFMLNFESLNPGTLRHMRKGHSPLQAIEAAKAVQDCGHTFVSNYFMHFPLENSGSIADESNFLEHAVHLLTPPRGEIALFPYGSNNRDEIYRDQSKYKVKVKPLKGNTWLYDVFDLGLPFSLWSYYYDERPSFNIDRLSAFTYYEAIKARDAVQRPLQTASLNWGKTKIPLRGKASVLLRNLRFFWWEFFYRIMRVTGKGKIFHKRMELFNYFVKIASSQPPESYEEETSESIWKDDPRMIKMKQKEQPSQFKLVGNSLIKDYSVPGKTEKWSRSLDNNELKILKNLYWTRTRKDVLKKFKDEIGENEIEEIIEKHLGYGSFVPFKGLLLCVANDKEFWK